MLNFFFFLAAIILLQFRFPVSTSNPSSDTSTRYQDQEPTIYLPAMNFVNQRG
jgi:hypothetical protein